MPLLQIDIEARYARFRDAMNQIERQTQRSATNMAKAFDGVKSTLAGLGVTAAAGALTSIVKNAIDAADHLNDLSKQTGVAVETLGGLGFAAGQAGGSLDSIASAAGKLNKSIAGAAGGNKEFSEAFKKMGIDIEDAQGKLKTADQVLIELANKFATYADGPEKVAIAQRLLGESGAEMIGFLNDGGQAIQENIEFYKRFAGVTQETADRADAFNDSLGKLGALSSGFGQRLAAELLPTMEGIASALVEARENGDEFNNWAENAASVINGLAYVSVGGKQALETIANTAGLAADAMKALANGKPAEIAEAWRQYRAAMQDSANDASAGFKALKNPPKPDQDEAIVAKYDKQIQEEWGLFNDRNRALKKLRDDDQISDKQYQARKLAAHKEAVEATKGLIDSQISTLTDKKLKAKTSEEAASIQARIDAKHKEKLFAGEDKRPAPILSSGSSKGRSRAVSVDDLEMRAADARNQALERMSDREREILANRNEFLADYYQEDLISIGDYFSGRRTAQDEALRAQEANINQEIANLQALKPKNARGRAEVDGKIEALIERRSQLQDAAGKAAIQLSIDETRAAKAFQDTLTGINAELLEQQGLLPQAAGIRFDQSNERIKTRLETERDAATNSGDTATAAARSADLDKLARLRALAVARAELNSIEEVATQVQFKLTAATVRAELSAKSGAVSELESLRTISDARLQAVADLQQVATALDAVARSTGDPRMLEQAQALQLEVEELAASADLVRERFEDAFTAPFESALEKMISGTASFKDVIKGLFGDIASEFTRMAARDFTKQLFGTKGALGGMVDFTARVFGGESKVPSSSADVASALAGTTGSAGAAAAASAQVATLGAAATGASTAMGVLTTGALPSLTIAAEAAAAALANIAATSGASSASGIAGLFGSAGEVMDYEAAVAATGWFRNGGVFAGGDVVPFAKGGIPGIVSAPTHFPMKDGGIGLMGEAGPEAIMPLARDAGGELAVRMVGARGTVDLLPVTRDGAGRMAVRAPVKAFASGGVFGAAEPLKRAGVGQIIDQASKNALSARMEVLAIPIGTSGADQGGSAKGGDTYLTVQVTPPAGSSSATAQQWGAIAGRQIQRSVRRNT